jgi:biopolymer transport protein ExbD
MPVRVFLPLLLAIKFAAAGPARADEFRQLVGQPLFDLPNRTDAKTHSSLTFRELEALPPTLTDARAALVVAATDRGNLAKLILSAGFRRLKSGDGDGSLVPIVIIERFETIDGSDRRSCKARGKETTLYDGFELDLDSGQIVPPGLGGDLVFRTDGPLGPRVVTLGVARLTTFEKMLPLAPPTPGRPSTGRAIQPVDFAGRYLLVADGQWSGSLELAVNAEGKVSGQFRSDKNGTVYAVAGAVAIDNPQKLSFTIQFPRSRQTFEGWLWTEGKNVIAGTLAMLEHVYSFVAIREGSSLIPEDLDLGPARAASVPGGVSVERRRLVVTVGPEADRFQTNGVVRTRAEIERELSALIKDEPHAEVSLRVADGTTFDRVRAAIRVLRAVGVESIHLSLSDGEDSPAKP